MDIHATQPKKDDGELVEIDGDHIARDLIDRATSHLG